MALFAQKIKIFLVGGVGYTLMEILFRGYSHWSMTVTGGICFLLLCRMNERNEKAPLWQRGLKGALIITFVEFMAGCIVNLWLGWNVWDYSAYSFNFLGQVCLAFSLIWFVLCLPLLYSLKLFHITLFSRLSR